MHHSHATRKARPAWRQFAQRGYLVGVLLFMLCVLCQVFLAGMSIFVSPSWWQVHRRFGELFGSLTILLLLFAIAMRPQRSIIWLTILLVVLYSLHYLLIELPGRMGVPWLSALHPVNAPSDLLDSRDPGTVCCSAEWERCGDGRRKSSRHDTRESMRLERMRRASIACVDPV